MKNHKISILLFLLIITFAACMDDSTTNQEETGGETEGEKLTENCLKDSEPNFLQQCSEVDISNITDLCEWKDLGGIVELSEEWTDWLPSYCCSAGDVLTYVNQDGHETHLIVKDKSHTISISSFTFNDPECEEGLKRINCQTIEFASVKFGSELLGIDLIVNITPQLNNRDGDLKPKLAVTIRHFIPGNFVSHLIANVEDDESTNHIFIEEKEFFGTTFSNLYTYENTSSNLALEMYYNKELGIVAFEDYDGVIWKLKE